MDKFREIVRMNEAPTRPLHLHRLVRPVLNEDGELDFVGVEDVAATDDEAKVLSEYLPSDRARRMIARRCDVSRPREIRGVAPSDIRLGVRSEVSDAISLSLTRMIAEYRLMYWGDEDRKDAERTIFERREQEMLERSDRQKSREEKGEWDFLYSNEEDYEI
jgi:hypothetical protein